MPTTLAIASTLVVAYFSTFIYCFIRNTFVARKTNFPSVFVPWDQNHIVWMITSVPLQPYLKQYLPKVIYDRLVLCIYGWEFHERLRPFEQYSGPRGNDKSYVLVSCGRFELWTHDAEIATQILARPKDFQQMDLTDLFLAKFGHNVLTSNGERWARQRKIVAGAINERVSKAVFDESARQTTGLLDEVMSAADLNGAAETSKLFDMAKKITIHVLSGAGLGAAVPWSDNVNDEPKPGFKLNYIQSIKAVINNVTGPILLPQWFLSNYPRFLPGHENLKAVSYALQEFPVHTTEMLNQEKERTKVMGSGSRSNIMSQLLQASKQPEGSLSDEEMMGNLFVFTAAGFDTTANTVSYALVLLARYPQWQDWLLEEIDSIVPSDPAVELDYVSIFPKATKLMAFMLETLRLFTPLIHIGKQTLVPQTIETSRGRYWLPANTTTYINAIALHADKKVWHGLNHDEKDSIADDDVWLFRPSRWINPPGSPEPLFRPPKGTFIPWSAGPRVCPGQKMAQVEFVGILLTLLRQHKVDAVALSGESRVDVDKRLDMRMRNSISILTLQMRDVYDVSDVKDQGLMLRVSKRR